MDFDTRRKECLIGVGRAAKKALCAPSSAVVTASRRFITPSTAASPMTYSSVKAALWVVMFYAQKVIYSRQKPRLLFRTHKHVPRVMQS